MMNYIQAKVLIINLDLEIKTWDGSRMTATREPALKSLQRLTGIDVKATFGTGLRARQMAKAWLEECVAETDAEMEKQEA